MREAHSADSVGDPRDLAFGLDGPHRDGAQLARVGHVRAAARAAQPAHAHHAHPAAAPHALVCGDGLGEEGIALRHVQLVTLVLYVGAGGEVVTLGGAQPAGHAAVGHRHVDQVAGRVDARVEEPRLLAHCTAHPAARCEGRWRW
eukprot:scaffold6639_cov63-Phaeocystis_antarctica.AAC.4